MAVTPAAEPLETDEAKLALEGLEKGEGEKGKGEGEEGKVKTPEELAEEAAVAGKLERLKPVEKEDGSMETDVEAKARVEAEDAAAAEPTEAQKLAAEVSDLRQIIRTSKRDQVQMKAKITRLEKRPVGVAEKEGEEEEEGEPGEKKKPKEKEEEPLSRVEELQEAISTVGKERGASLDILLATMKASGAYKDVTDVCSRGNFDDIFEAIATEASKDTGKDYDEVLLEVELNVWAKENPYEYMYELIKKYHPSYAEQTAKPGEKGKKEKVIADAPGSIADKGGDGNIAAGWTAKRIDDMEEDKLSTVPEDVYDKYLKGELK